MKKVLVFLIIFLLSCFVFAQKLEVAGSIPVAYWENNDPYEGTSPSISTLIKTQDSFIFNGLLDESAYGGDFYRLENLKKTKLTNTPAYLDEIGYEVFGYIPYGVVYGFTNQGSDQNQTDLYIEYKGNKWHITENISEIIGDKSNIIFTDNTLFFRYNNSLSSIKLLENGKYKYYSFEETREYLTPSKRNELGLDKLEMSFGDSNFDDSQKGIWWKIWNQNFVMNNSKYKDCKTIKEIKYVCIGADSKGLLYFRKIINEKSFYIAVLDVWNNKVYFYEDAEKNGWEMNEDHFSSNWTVTPDGNIYFADLDEKKENFLIKKIPNSWYSELDINKRKIGRITTNKITLCESPAETSKADGFNYENDIVWEKETKGEWSRIQKVDGREGWVLTKYIDFSEISSSNYNVVVNKIMQPNDNLRLRKEEATSSETILTMIKGTKVKVLKLGKEEIIDGIKSCWVQVEVQSGGKDKNGKEIKEGTIGWCYGGFLE